ncbi:hypothetical protein SBV1_3350002 [Verrucomicrobia bacterium]|nr:hypothetical protein SBV1_3350002 [Verrucomicrobiota bacterium]
MEAENRIIAEQDHGGLWDYISVRIFSLGPLAQQDLTL